MNDLPEYLPCERGDLLDGNCNNKIHHTKLVYSYGYHCPKCREEVKAFMEAEPELPKRSRGVMQVAMYPGGKGHLTD